MRYELKHVSGLFGRFVIRNEAGEVVASVEGQMQQTVGRELVFADATGRQIAFIKGVGQTWGHVYKIFRDDELVAVVSNLENTRHYTIDLPGTDDLSVEGDMWLHEYFFVRGGKAVAQVSKTWWTMADTYGVQILDGENVALILACAVIIDLTRG